MKIGVLAVQGAFVEHEQILKKLGVEYFEVRKKEDLLTEVDGIILPGGESTVMGKLLNDLGLFSNIKEKIKEGMPVLGTCAGAILLAKEIEGRVDAYFGTIPMKIRRNAYGRQLGSFVSEQEIVGIGSYPMRFIRAPYILSTDSTVKVLGTVDDRIVAVEFENQIALTFHPELTEDFRIHKYFVGKCRCR
ncbi:pyridoxal 5'-phosphate synthase glutaminase subunit PdxT [Novisyntrophococcus fermenticellae]|uniref:pyridoxal 5'-phosphate synthase glutaminase subunit PdxT n=1 Tax=Novisyntrophococcus fermenticellae TaxID=2068655 RepID=UPI001E3D5AE1|nr:pyridoxal 5'-phosphate synthase glutaminase subunit PdxT [Novisyntrophococcus fermenticellae]